jgi:O-antigen/teichoic acid export membrane protein
MILSRLRRPAARLACAAILERALLGATTFAVTVLLGRWGGPEELGLFIIFFPLLFVAIAIQESLVTAPYTVYSADHDDVRDRRAYLGGVLANATALGAFASLVFLIAAVALFAIERRAPGWVAMSLAIATPMVLLREFARRVVYAELRPQTAVAISGGVSLLQLAMMATLHLSGRLNAATSFTAMGASSAVVAAVWFAANRSLIQYRRAPGMAAFRKNWSLGSWSVATQVGEIVRTQMFPWLLAIVASDATAGVFGACAIIAALPTPLHVALSNILLPQFVQELKQRGAAAADRLMWHATAWLSGVMAIYFAAIVAVSPWIVPAVYGAKYAGTQHALIVLTLAQVFAGASLPAARALFVLHRPDQVFYSHLVGIIINLTLGVTLTRSAGITGAAYATLAGAVLKAGLGLWWYLAEARRQLVLAEPQRLHTENTSPPDGIRQGEYALASSAVGARALEETA